ncbi:hypothetical protein OROGR_022512 [Orobanche gracilis]
MRMILAYNEDLLTAIFIYLPPKTLIRLKLVCKHWFSLISSDNFSHQHTLRHRSKTEPSLLLRLLEESNHHIYLHLNRYAKILVPYHFSPSLAELTISSYSNGLFLLRSPRTIENPVEECCIYNPTTKQSRKIMLNVDERYTSVMGLTLAFDPSNMPHYKIICVRSTRGRPTNLLRRSWRFCRIEVYESEKGAWSPHGEPFWAPMDVDFNRGVYLNCCVHWHGMYFYYRRESFVGEHPKIVVPNCTGTGKLRENYVESGGYLHNIAHFPERHLILVFELESNFSEWSLKYRVDLNGVFGLLSVLSIVIGESGEGRASLVLHEPGKVMAYEFQEESMKEVVDFREEGFYEEGCMQFSSNCTFQFVETLSPV